LRMSSGDDERSLRRTRGTRALFIHHTHTHTRTLTRTHAIVRPERRPPPLRHLIQLLSSATCDDKDRRKALRAMRDHVTLGTYQAYTSPSSPSSSSSFLV
jgi:hypothetical protein